MAVGSFQRFSSKRNAVSQKPKKPEMGFLRKKKSENAFFYFKCYIWLLELLYYPYMVKEMTLLTNGFSWK
jgi:hypothetical protein